MSFVVASSILRSRAPTALRAGHQLRSLHVDNVVGNNMPFKYEKKTAYGSGLALFLISGFSIPFIAAVYQLRKAAAA